MFSGIIEKKSKILNINDGKFRVENIFGNELNIGQSIAHDGACMTVDSFDEKSYSIFAMEESLKKTNFGEKKVGDSFNLERCVKVGDRIDGHFVTGHIDCIGDVNKIDIKQDNSMILGISFDEKFSKLLVNKGSITINGVSLTVITNKIDYLEVSLIPLTMEITNLGDLSIGDKVNLEFDILGKYILNK